MNPWMFAAGVVTLVAAAVDLLWTTIAVSRGRGPLTQAIATAVWRAAVRTGRHRVLRLAGYLVIILIPITWAGLAYAGFALMFLSEPGSVQQASPPYGPASAVATAAFAAGGLAGAGAGYVAGGPLWQALNNVSALAGLALFTFALTYLFQVVTAVTQQRALASTIDGLGDDPVAILLTALEEDGLGQLPSQLSSITAQLYDVDRKRMALPILQFFHTGDRSESIARNVAVFDEIVTLMSVVLQAPHATVVRPAREAVNAYLHTTQIAVRREPPEPPDVARLCREGDDRTQEPGSAKNAIDEVADRRAVLHAVVSQEGWSWSDVYPEPATP